MIFARGRVVRLCLAGLAGLILAGAPAHAQGASGWPEPLDRKIDAHLRDVSLRDALDRVAATARIRLSYSSDVVPLDRVVRVSLDSTAVGDVLIAILRGVSVAPVPAGRNQVALAPVVRPARAGPSSRVSDTTAVPPSMLVQTLDRVVVTGSADGASERSRTVGVDVLPGAWLRRNESRSLAEALDLAVPGLWAWSQTPSSLLARYGSIRGASSFGASYPKVYIDGIEVANPLLVTYLDPESIQRIEVIRGPQGAALYGADAISGVVNILTRHDGADAGEGRATVRGGAGAAATEFAAHAVLAQEHAFAIRSGSSVASAGLNVSAGGLGEYYPGASSRHVLVNSGMRWIGGRASIVGVARLFAERAGSAENPLISDSLRGPVRQPGTQVGDSTPAESVTEYTLGATARLDGGGRWSHSLVAGLDGYRLAAPATAFTPFPTSVDSALLAARGAAVRGSVRLASVARLGTDRPVSATLTFAAEHSTLREETPTTRFERGHQDSGGMGGGGPGGPVGGGSGPAGQQSTSDIVWIYNSGLVAQADVALRQTLYLTAGARLERSNGFAALAEYSTLPMAGIAYAREIGGTTLKLRSAYGKGIRAPRTASRETVVGRLGARQAAASLEPEAQSGVEGGFDLQTPSGLAFHLTRFGQRATGLIQQVAIVDTVQRDGRPMPRLDFASQNVGAIDNRGWEIRGTLERGPLTLGATVATVESRVARLAVGYSGDLRPGDRMLEVPARTASASASWSAPRWSLSLNAVRAFDWVGYDRLALARAVLAAEGRPADLVGAHLRQYWTSYDGVTRIGALTSREIRRGLTAVLSGSNLLNRQRGEPDNVTIVPGRTITLGLRAIF